MKRHPDLVATYRIQLTPTFGFAETIELLDHLVALGVSHVYLSPIAEAVPGSSHGYDVVDHTTVRAEFGGETGLLALLDAASGHGLGVLIDHVPNHMSVAEAHRNARWWEMLRDGPESSAAAWFDVDWEVFDGRVILPKLGEPLDEVLTRGQLTIGRGDLGPELRYGPLRFPLAAGTEDLDVAASVERQHYSLQWWRDPARNVRRFFTIDDLVAVRAERPEVAAVIDALPARLADHPAFAGVRVDHVDGLARPGEYLRGLRSRIGDHRLLFVEKILAVGEAVPPAWPVDGTTGYEHIRVTEHALLDPGAERPLTGVWNDMTGDPRPFAEVEDQARREVLAGGLRPDLDRLVRAISGSGSELGDVDAVRDAVTELTIGVHRYRTYLPDDPRSVDEFDAAVERAVAARPEIRDVTVAVAGLIRQRPEIAIRWEQLCSPVMAKGAEDRAFFRYLRLGSLCEVGGAPGDWSLSAEGFHRHQLAVQRYSPATMLAGTTHDTKRSEGVRARSLALAEISDDWARVVRRWMRDHHEYVDALDPATVLLALQTAVTAWPIEVDRLTEYLLKSSREADLRTSWTDPDSRYESALGRLADALVEELRSAVTPRPGDAGRDAPEGLADVVARILRPGWAFSLGALAIRLTAPGVPDLYQGTAAFTYSLVDPDNRIEPDWDERRALVRAAAGLDGPASWIGDDIEASKAVVITRGLALRRRHAAACGVEGGYRPLEVSGAQPGVLAFARLDGGGVARTVTVVPTRSSDEGSTVSLPPGRWRHVLSDGSPPVDGDSPVPVSELLAGFPIDLLERVDR